VVLPVRTFRMIAIGRIGDIIRNIIKSTGRSEARNRMAKRDPRVDAYIAKSAEFARPILKHLRDLVHQGCPEAEETLKWSMPSFVFKGLLCGMAAFKHPCAHICDSAYSWGGRWWPHWSPSAHER